MDGGEIRFQQARPTSPCPTITRPRTTSGAPPTCSSAAVSAVRAAGTLDEVSLYADYHFTKHFDGYAGIAYSTSPAVWPSPCLTARRPLLLRRQPRSDGWWSLRLLIVDPNSPLSRTAHAVRRRDFRQPVAPQGRRQPGGPRAQSPLLEAIGAHARSAARPSPWG